MKRLLLFILIVLCGCSRVEVKEHFYTDDPIDIPCRYRTVVAMDVLESYHGQEVMIKFGGQKNRRGLYHVYPLLFIDNEWKMVMIDVRLNFVEDDYPFVPGTEQLMTTEQYREMYGRLLEQDRLNN
jgi:hypothetical protein